MQKAILQKIRNKTVFFSVSTTHKTSFLSEFYFGGIGRL